MIETYFDIKDYNNYRPKNASEIYRITSNSFDLFEEFIRESGSNLMNEIVPLKFIEKEIGQQRIYINGEVHFKRAVIDHIHNTLLEKIEKYPSSWLLLQEGANKRDRRRNLPVSPSHFYLHNLSKLYGLPYKEALADLLSEKTRDYMRKDKGITGEQIDKIIIEANIFQGFFMGISKFPEEMDIEEKEKLIGSLSLVIKKPKNYIKRLIDLSILEDFSNHDRLMESWNKISKERFFRLRQQYNDKKNILIIAGQNHILAFDSLINLSA